MNDQISPKNCDENETEESEKDEGSDTDELTNETEKDELEDKHIEDKSMNILFDDALISESYCISQIEFEKIDQELNIQTKVQKKTKSNKKKTQKSKVNNNYILRKDLGKTLDMLVSLFHERIDIPQEPDLIKPLYNGSSPNELTDLDEEFHNAINNFNIDYDVEVND